MTFETVAIKPNDKNEQNEANLTPLKNKSILLLFLINIRRISILQPY